MTEKQREKMNQAAREFNSKELGSKIDFKAGYTAAHNDANAIIEIMEKALKHVSDWNNWQIQPVISKKTDEALAELNKWRNGEIEK